MKIVLLGANGRTGREVMRLALAAGHNVTGLVRSADSLSDMQHENLQVGVGNVCDPEFLKEVFPGHDAVLSTLGPRLPTNSACKIYSESAVSITEAMQAAGLKRVIVTSTALLFPPIKVMDNVIRFIARNNFKAAGLMEETIRNVDLDWTFARVGFLNDKNQRAFLKKSGKMPRESNAISRFAVAQFMVDDLQQSNHIKEVVGLCGPKVG